MKIRVMCERHQSSVAPDDPSETDALRTTERPYWYEFDTSHFFCLKSAALYEDWEARNENADEAQLAWANDEFMSCTDTWYFEVEGDTLHTGAPLSFHVR
jgi:hypothetical protein